MHTDDSQHRSGWERGVVILSIDTEQRWGYVDVFNDAQFERRYPDAIKVHERLLASLRIAGLSATWFVVGGMSLRSSRGAHDRRMAGLPGSWVSAIPAGTETSEPLWYRQSFLERLRDAAPAQEIGLHGGLTHFIWTGARATREAVEWELSEGLRALHQIRVRPSSFSFGREQEAHHDLLWRYGLRCYRGRTVSLAHRLGPSLPGKMLRAANELVRAVPPLVWPRETMPGLWNIPSSLFLYPLGATRSRVIGLSSRVERFCRGVEAAAKYRGIFHFCLHPENLAESPGGCPMFEEMLDRLLRVAGLGDVEVMTMGAVAARMELSRGFAAAERCDTSLTRVGVSTAASEPAYSPDPNSKERKIHE